MYQTVWLHFSSISLSHSAKLSITAQPGCQAAISTRIAQVRQETCTPGVLTLANKIKSRLKALGKVCSLANKLTRRPNLRHSPTMSVAVLPWRRQTPGFGTCDSMSAVRNCPIRTSPPTVHCTGNDMSRTSEIGECNTSLAVKANIIT